MRRYPPILIAPLVAGVMLAVCAVAAAQAQNLLSPSFDGEPATFSSAATFGNPPGFGAGRSGFNSANQRAGARARTSARAPALPRANPPPYAVRPGASAPPPAPVDGGVVYADGTVAPAPRAARPQRPPVLDPFEPLGLRVRSFVVKPAVELSGGYDSNPARVPLGTGAQFFKLAPEMLIRSDWQRHEFTADLRGSATRYKDRAALNADELDLKASARIDVSTRTRAEIEGRYQRASSVPGDPNTPTGVVSPPVFDTVSANALLAHRFNRFEISVKGLTERTEYDNSLLRSGDVLDNSDRNYRLYGGLLRGSYELLPGVKPFVEVGRDRRAHDREVDSAGFRRDSDGETFRIGTTFELTRKLTGEVSAGYLRRDYVDPRLEELRGLIADASLVWVASGLTTATLTMKSAAEESTLIGVSGILQRDVSLFIEHALRRYWTIGGRIGYGLDSYQGIPREDKRKHVAALTTYKIGRNVQIKGELRREWFSSSEPGLDYTTNVYLAGLRFQL